MESLLVVPELLEAILLKLDMTTLLVSAPRVSKSWNHLIQVSPSIQRALFFQPMIISDENDDEHPKPPTINPLLAKHFGRLFFDTDNGTNGEKEHSLFRQRAITFHTLPWRPSNIIYHGTLPPYDLHPLEPSSCAPFTRRGASWRRMLPCQPPPKTLGLISFANAANGNPRGRVVDSALIPPASGSEVRMAQLYDLVQHHISHYPQYSSYHGGPTCESLWFRVSWTNKPFSFPRLDPAPAAVRSEVNRLFRSTSVVVELYPEKDEEPYDSHPAWRWWDDSHPSPCPEDVAGFDGLFRCEEAGEGGGEEVLKRLERKVVEREGRGGARTFNTDFQIWNPERYRAGDRMEYLWGNPEIENGGGWHGWGDRGDQGQG